MTVPCAPKCLNATKKKKYVTSPVTVWYGNANAVNNQRVIEASQKAICYECGNQGHYRSDCPEQKKPTHKNQLGAGAHGVVHTLRGGETDQDPNNKKDEIEA
ncbi:putative reverse transcriptase domain-containing protein [Tanacetum coccineum]